MTSYSICFSLPDVSLNIIFSRSIHLAGNDRISFFMIEEYYIPHFLKPHICNSHFICLYFLDIVNSDAVNIRVHAYFWISAFIFSRYIPRSVIGGSQGSFFFFFKNLNTLFNTDCICLHFHQQYATVLFSAFSPVFVTCRLFDDNYSKKCEIIPYCGFDFHFSYN